MSSGEVHLINRTILFDCDGVLVDSRAGAEKAWAQWSIEHGLDPLEVNSVMHGRRSADTVASFLSASKAKEAAAKIDALEIDGAGEATPIPGAVELLASLPRGRWAVVTSGGPELVRARLKGAGLPLPDVLITSADVTNGKPAPDPYLKAAAALGVEPGDTIVIEDSEAGIAAGLAAGAHQVVGVGDHAQGHGADFVIKDLRELKWRDPGA